MQGPKLDPDPDGVWPSCDQEPPGISIRPLSHADLAALLANRVEGEPAAAPLSLGR
jgi:hypothetical protein